MSKWPQPHEGVAGVKRTRDDLLSLDPAALRRRVIILDIARSLWQATLRGAHNEYGRSAYERMSKPRMGDLVVETMGMAHPSKADRDGSALAIHSFGIMLGERTEWACTNEKWQEYVEEDSDLTDDDRATDTAIYVQYGPEPEDVCRWVNCSIIALPTGALYHTADQNP